MDIKNEFDYNKTWNIIDSIFYDKSILVKHHIDSFNNFIDTLIPQTLREYSPVKIFYNFDENIHKYILNKETTIQEIHIYLHETSLKYNTDKKTILQFYFDYLIRNKTELINRDFLNIIKSVTHCDYIANEEIIDYLCYYLRDHYL